jgi:hypothetical protein
VLTELLHGPRGQAQRAAGIALHESAPGPVPAITERTGHGLTPTAPSPTVRHTGRRRLALTAAIAAATVSLGVAAPLAYAYAEAPTRFIAVTHYLHGDRR